MFRSEMGSKRGSLPPKEGDLTCMSAIIHLYGNIYPYYEHFTTISGLYMYTNFEPAVCSLCCIRSGEVKGTAVIWVWWNLGDSKVNCKKMKVKS